MSTAPEFRGPVPAAPGEVLRRAVGELRETTERARAALTRQAFDTCRDQTAAALTIELARVAELAAAGTAIGLGRVADSDLPQQEGFVTPGSWWRSVSRIDKDSAGDQMRLARRLRRHYETTATAWREGGITGEHAELIATGVDGVLQRLKRRVRREAAEAGEPVDQGRLTATIEDARAGLEAELLALGRAWGPDTLRVALEHARLGADPDGASQQQMDAEDDSHVKLAEVGDMAVLTAHVTREVGAKLRTILDHYRDQAHHSGTGPDARRRSTAPDDVDPVTGDPVVRSNAQRDAAALTAWVDASLGGGLGGNPHSERPHLDVVVSLQDLAAGIGSAVLERTGSPVPATSTARIACDADVRVVLVDGQYRDPHTGELIDPAVAGILLAGSGVLDYGRTRRIVPARLRRLLAHRDRGCVFPGCHRPPQHTEAHHVVPWQGGGPTDLANCVLLCARHHHVVHEGGWTMVARGDIPYWQPGHWRFVPPKQRTRP